MLAANLYRVLGKKTHKSEFLDKDKKSNFYQEDNITHSDSIDSTKQKLLKLDKNFSYETFLEGAKNAFNLIVSSYKKDKLVNVKDLLSPKVYEIFNKVMKNDKEKGYKNNYFKIVELKAAILKVNIEKKIVTIKVEFLSKQNISENDVSDIKDVWTFEKNINDKNPNWLLIEVNSE